MPNGLYGSGNTSQGLYGSAALSERNQRQAQQLNLPGAINQPGEAGQAGSQEAAQSDWANFEDIFNKNRGYSGRMQEAAVGKVRETAGEKPNTGKLDLNSPNVPAPKALPMPDQTTAHRPKAPSVDEMTQPAAPAQAPTGTVNPQAPQALQAGSLTGIQNKADLLKGYGQASQAAAPAPLQVVGAPQGVQQVPVQKPAEEQPQAQSYANTGIGQRSRAGATPQMAGLVPPAPTADVAAPPPPGATPGAFIAPVAEAPVAVAGQKDPESMNPAEYATYLEKNLPAQKNGKEAPTDEELSQLDKLTKTNDLLVGYGGGVDSMGEERQGDGGVDILQQVYGSGAGQWDADIMNTGGGRTAFGELQKQYGGKDREMAQQIDKRIQNTAATRASLLDQIKNYKAPGTATPADTTVRINAIPTTETGQALGVTQDIMAAWQALGPDQARAQMLGNKNYLEASGEKSSLPGLLNGTFGVSPDDARKITSYLSPEDWQAYQQALERAIAEKNPKAVIEWISAMLTKVKDG